MEIVLEIETAHNQYKLRYQTLYSIAGHANKGFAEIIFKKTLDGIVSEIVFSEKPIAYLGRFYPHGIPDKNNLLLIKQCERNGLATTLFSRIKEDCRSLGSGILYLETHSKKMMAFAKKMDCKPVIHGYPFYMTYCVDLSYSSFAERNFTQ
jgi:hypothetical protein